MAVIIAKLWRRSAFWKMKPKPSLQQEIERRRKKYFNKVSLFCKTKILPFNLDDGEGAAADVGGGGDEEEEVDGGLDEVGQLPATLASWQGRGEGGEGQVRRVRLNVGGVVGGSKKGDFCEERRFEVDRDHFLRRPRTDWRRMRRGFSKQRVEDWLQQEQVEGNVTTGGSFTCPSTSIYSREWAMDVCFFPLLIFTRVSLNIYINREVLKWTMS